MELTTETWKTVYKMAHTLTTDIKLISFNYKITHRTLVVGEKLTKWEITKTDNCNMLHVGIFLHSKSFVLQSG